MARLFDHNVANYMSRSSVNLGLNGLTECSVAYWLKLTAVDATLNQRIVQKQIADGWSSFQASLETNSSRPRFSFENQTSGDYPTWIADAGIGTGVWARVLCTWKRNAITVADGLIYVNGVSVALTLDAGSVYTAGTTIEETSNNLYYGIRPVTLTSPLDGALAWVNVWNRQLTAAEALADYASPGAVTSGLVSRVQVNPDTDAILGGSMAVTGTLASAANPNTVAVTGTATASIAEPSIVTGSTTLILTATNETFVDF